MNVGIVELIIVMVATIAPMWFFAQTRGLDELTKTGTGVILAACFLAITQTYKAWAVRQESKDGESKE